MDCPPTEFRRDNHVPPDCIPLVFMTLRRSTPLSNRLKMAMAQSQRLC
ncbi:hypothetical protein THTE_2239 [Thermogutta terrifontis]|uniref:Uncharacterized protein n=1 Tax=Thermogutta terrifontis TaxID=1331910 RepID=A0A286RFV6_9BACT|nr:hypothetical protein THTE_2239 [Thermogutta terrifontis]